MTMLFERAKPAMGSLFTVRLIGDDEEHLSAVADAAFAEIDRVERLLSWRDVRSECSRINREAAAGPVLVDYEMLAILQTCDEARRATDGYFDIVAARQEPRPPGTLQLDAARRTIQFTGPECRLDFGAFGKGYALDRAADELRRYGVTRALLDGGSSSILAMGDGPEVFPWRVGLRNPFVDDAPELQQLLLRDTALSCSAVFGSGDKTSDVVDPHTARPLADRTAVAVVANSAEAAEVLSTALLAMGKERAAAYIKETQNAWLAAASRVVWISESEGAANLETLLA